MPEFTAPSARTEFAGDPDLDGLAGIGAEEESSDLDDLARELTADVIPTSTIRVEGRPGYAVRFRLDFTGKDLDLLRKRAKDKRFVDGVDGVKFASLLLATTALAIVRNGEDLELDGTSPITFVSRELQALIGTGSADETIRKFYGLEGHVDAAARKVMADAGWGDDAVEADPTE